MTAGHRVRPATRSDLPELGRVLGRAFDDDPVMSYVIGRRPVGPRAEAMLRASATVHLPTDSVFVAVDDATGSIVGGSVWAPPDHWRVAPRQYVRHVPSVLRAVGLRGVRHLSILSTIERAHAREPHHYLAVLGTEPSHQGRGIGGSLLTPTLERCDAEGLGAYLESSKESNLPFYGRYGFEVIRKLPLGDGPPVWLMWRSPKG